MLYNHDIKSFASRAILRFKPDVRLFMKRVCTRIAVVHFQMRNVEVSLETLGTFARVKFLYSREAAREEGESPPPPPPPRKRIGLDLHAITSMEIRAGSTSDTRGNLFSHCISSPRLSSSSPPPDRLSLNHPSA